MHVKQLVIPIVCTLLPGSVLAQRDQTPDSDLPEWAASSIDSAHDSVGSWVDYSARSLDGLIGTEDSLTVENDSYLRLTQETLWEESAGFSNDVSVRFKLDLPTSQERLRLLIESDPEESLGTLAEQGSNSQLNEQLSSNNAIIGLDQLTPGDKYQQWSYRLGAGIKFRTPIDPYVRATGERVWRQDNGPWELGSYNRLSWFDSDGYSARSHWDLNRPLDGNRRLRSYTQFQWQETEDTLEFSQRFELAKRLDSRSHWRNGLIVVGESLSSPRINDYYLQSWYRRDIHKGRLFLDLIPELHFDRDSDFEPRWAMTLRLEFYLRKAINREPR
ncbi:hypothetical protein [Marinobacterium weihaiense]|uniref:Uncharacterized protein n=1 Tax=Marinobacterium weihaiense TaxID=2851016 RepID=A0ABS6M7W2_9GAMM|nr:hypothetical protein [Marinobacterium weihaiense]MBV0932280.1 hypothetical protein [Marinobacterium weihaiense]